ncbi:MAG: MCP four helix bundle domain-containing protein [Gammaproteobacteria bacterium]
MTSQTYNPSVGTYRRLTVKGLVVLLAVIIVFTVINLKDIDQAQGKSDQMVNDIAVKLVTAELMVAMIKTVDIYTRNIILVADAQIMRDELEKLLGARSIYDMAEARLERVFVSQEDREQLSKIKELRVKARPMVDHAISLGLKNMDKEATPYLLHEVVPVNEQRLAALNGLIKRQQALNKKIASDISRTHARAQILTCVLGLLALALGISTFIFLPPKIRAYYEGPREDEVTPTGWS